MNRSMLVGLFILAAIVIVGGAYGLYGEKIHNQDVNATTAVVTPDGVKTVGPERSSP